MTSERFTDWSMPESAIRSMRFGLMVTALNILIRVRKFLRESSEFMDQLPFGDLIAAR